MTAVTLYHNPRCSKSRAAADYLAQQNVETRIVRYLDTPPDISVLHEIFGKLGLTDVRGMMRVKDDLYRELKLDDPCRKSAASARMRTYIAGIGRIGRVKWTWFLPKKGGRPIMP